MVDELQRKRMELSDQNVILKSNNDVLRKTIEYMNALLSYKASPQQYLAKHLSGIDRLCCLVFS